MSATVLLTGSFSYFFSPAAVEIGAGGSVTFVWNAGVHNLLIGGSEVVGVVPSPYSYTYTFSSPGTYGFECTVHPGMVGTAIVH